MENAQELWQVDANGKIFDTNLAEMTSWIDEGALLRQDKVRKGNLRWIEAGKVPSLIAVFNAKENGQPLPPVVTTTNLGSSTLLHDSAISSNHAAPIPEPSVIQDHLNVPASPGGVCSLHNEVPAEYVCDTCANTFCKACPNSYGGSVKICPFCGAMCRSIVKAEKERRYEIPYLSANREGFGFGDFAKALAYPFRFKTSLILGALMFMLFSIGQSVTSFGGIFMLYGAIACFMLANTLTFGILANAVENFTQGKLDVNFMPSFDEFSLWDDVVHPFFLSIGVYISSFGPLIAVLLIAVFMIMGSVKNQMNGMQSDAARMTNPDVPYAANAVAQSERVREILKKNADEQKRRIAAMETGEMQPDEINTGSSIKDADQFNAERMNQMIQEQRKAQLESAIGKTPETVAKEREALVSKLLGYGFVFLLIGGVCLLWGLFYFPAACAVAGYTRSFTATLNPFVGLDTIKRLGIDYFKILLMGLLIAIVSGFIGGVLNAVFSPFNLPGMGNIPAKAVGSLFGFYFSVVFSCVIGYALYKASDRLKLPG